MQLSLRYDLVGASAISYCSCCCHLSLFYLTGVAPPLTFYYSQSFSFWRLTSRSSTYAKTTVCTSQSPHMTQDVHVHAYVYMRMCSHTLLPSTHFNEHIIYIQAHIQALQYACIYTNAGLPIRHFRHWAHEKKLTYNG